MEVVKRTGWDWDVTWEDEHGVEDVMTVFGAMTIIDAISDATQSITAGELFGEEPVQFAITAVARRL